MKMIYYKVVKTTIDVLSLAKVIINIMIRHHCLSKLIINNYIVDRQDLVRDLVITQGLNQLCMFD